MSENCFKIAFVPFDASGHVNSCLGLAKNLRDRDHQCVFIANQNWNSLIVKHGFENRVYVEEHKSGDKGSWNDWMIEHAETLKLPPFEKIRKFEAPVWPMAINDVKLFNGKIKQILDQLKPDAIVVDSFIAIPAVVSAGVPWIDLCSCNPMFYFADEDLPPGLSGYPMNSNKQMWKAFRDEVIDAFSDCWNSYSSWLVSIGAPTLESKTKMSIKSPDLNLYLCPKELNPYPNGVKPDDVLWFGIDSLMRTDDESVLFEIPEQIRDLPGNWIYISMGTLCCSELNLMRRLVNILKKSVHRIIVSKGPLGDQLDLADNMWGQNSVPQLKVLPLVDLVITHGGNNTVTESLYFGKPMIVLPVFGDQYDNAQAIVENGLGIRLDPYFCTEEQLLLSIEKILNDSELKEKYRKISNRIKESQSRVQASELIEQVIKNSKKNFRQ